MYKDKYIIEFIKLALNKDYKLDSSKINEINWDDLFQEAKKHNLLALVYLGISRAELKKYIDDELLKRWKEGTFCLSIKEFKQMNNLKELLKTFNKEGLDVIVLKGALIKRLYPNRDLRTMSDIDFVVKKEKYLNSIDIIKKLGYKEIATENNHKAHEGFTKNNQLIEIHWKLINDDFFEKMEKFDNEIWNNIVEDNIDGERVLVLNHQYMIVHLIAHMAVHTLCSGFGIRQLLDLFLYSRAYESEINWNEVESLLEENQLKKFSKVLYKAIEVLFDYKLKDRFLEAEKIDNEFVECFINYIFENGVFGGKDKVSELEKTISYGGTLKGEKNGYSLLRLIFPKREYLENNYKYLKKFRYLLLIAWIDHFFKGVFHKEFTVKDKFNLIFKSVKKVNSKEEILQQLDLV